MPKVSVIVPVYNTEEYLEKCLNSLVGQTLEDIEIIVVNDGSPDNSYLIIEKFVKLYPNKIIYINKPNGGMGDARNFGIKRATGEYIGFVDSDDYVEKEMFEELYDKAKTEKFDIVVSDAYMVYPDNKEKQEVGSSVEQDTFDKLEIKKIMIKIYPSPWNKIYKRELFDSIEFKKGIWFEDTEILLRLIPEINSIGVLKKPYYNYLQRQNSITYTFNKKLYDLIDNMDGVIEYYKNKGIYEEYKDELEYLYVRYAFATFMKRLAKSKNKTLYKEGYEYAMKKVIDTFPKYKENKYLNITGLKGYYIKHFNKFLSNLNYIVENKKKYN